MSFFAVGDDKGKHLTRDGRFMMNRTGELILSTEQTTHVLDDKGKPNGIMTLARA